MPRLAPGSLEDSAVEVRMAAMEVMQDMNPGDEEVPRAAATSPASRDINGDDRSERLLKLDLWWCYIYIYVCVCDIGMTYGIIIWRYMQMLMFSKNMG